MRKLVTIVILAVAVSLCTARPASAQWAFFRWLSEFDPGPFAGAGAGYSFCQGIPAPGKSSVQGGPCENDTTRFERIRWVFSPEVSFSAEVTKNSGSHHLTYPTGSSVADHMKILVTTFGFDYRIQPNVDVGAGVGFASFLGGLNTVNKFVIAPRVLIRSNTSTGVVSSVGLRLGALVVPGGLKDSDFGATSSVLSGKTEAVFDVSVVVSFRVH